MPLTKVPLPVLPLACKIPGMVRLALIAGVAICQDQRPRPGAPKAVGAVLPKSYVSGTRSESEFIAKDIKKSIRVSGMTHVRTSPYLLSPIERKNRTLG